MIDHKTYPDCFNEFWRWKVQSENGSSHILDEKHREEAFRRLGLTLRKWQWHRPQAYSNMAARLRNSLRDISTSYAELRFYSFLEMRKIPSSMLERIWCALGSVKSKEQMNSANPNLIMPITKPLMFLWGQTLAFDSVVRAKMPKLENARKSQDHWTFKEWVGALLEFRDRLMKQPEIIHVFEELSRKEYGKGPVPYGQFLDLYYWCADRKCNS
ncbi:MAG: hypothetical protein WCC94_08475 [Candidatus Bathyarchaeia archaeon]